MPQSPPSSPQTTLSTPRIVANPWVVLLVLVLGFFMILLDTTIVNVAIPSIITGLQAGLDQILWVLNAYVLVYAVLLITPDAWETCSGLNACSCPDWSSLPWPLPHAAWRRTQASSSSSA
jgi:hypothetical protein